MYVVPYRNRREVLCHVILLLAATVIGGSAWVNVHNPDGVTCSDAVGCHYLLKDVNNVVVATDFFGVEVRANAASHCTELTQDGTLIEAACGVNHPVVCQIECDTSKQQISSISCS